ncbi:MAG: hypothetical protein ACYDB3_03900 [Acidimicrobiales bacterium]
MHPIERLRYVARAGWAGPAELGAEAAWALAELTEHEPAAVLPACRRLLERNPSCGPLWWVAARLITAGDCVAEAERCAGLLEDDPTARQLEDALTEGARVGRHGGMGEVASADLVVVETDAMGPTGMVVDGDDCAMLEAARVAEVDVWVQAGTGRVLPARLWDALLQRLEVPPPRTVRVGSPVFDAGGRRHPPAVVDLRGVTRVVGPKGARPVRDALGLGDCPEPPELLSRW